MSRIPLLILVALLFAAQPLASARPSTDQAQIQGKWEIVCLVNYGAMKPADMVQNARLTFTGNRFAMTGGEHNFEGTFALNPEESPKTIEAAFVMVDRGTKRTARGIYELTGDRLTVCWREDDGEQLTAFKSEPGSATRLIVLQRARK